VTEERVLPRNLEAERAVLGSILAHGETLALVQNDLAPGDFFRRAHGQLYAAMLALDDVGTPIDLVPLRDYLKASGLLEEVGGPAYVVSLMDGMPRGANIAYYAGIVHKHARKRAEVGVFARLLEQAYADDTGPDELLEQATTAVDGLRETHATIGALNPAQQWAALVEETRNAPKTRIYLGIPSLDNLLRGVHPGEVCGIMARPSVGKTLILGHMLRAVAETECGVVVFSLEMPAAQIAMRLARTVYGYTRDELEDKIHGGLSGQRYEEALPRTVLVDAPGLSLAKMETALRNLTPRLLENQPPRVVVIDHLGLIGGDRGLSTYDRVSTQAREIKELAKRHRVAVLLAIQVNRDIGGDGSRELTLGAARDSGVVEEAVDYLVGCRRMDFCSALSREQRVKYENAIFLKVLKNRHGELGRELAVRMDTRTLELREDLDLYAEHTEDVGAITRIRRLNRSP